MRTTLLLTSLLAGLGAHNTALTQSPDIQSVEFRKYVSNYAKLLEEGNESARTLMPGFRLIMKPEKFEPRLNATLQYRALTTPEGAIAALMDPRTGAPLQACKTPCTLNLAPSQSYKISYFKFGHIPRVLPLTPNLLEYESRPRSMGINLFEAYHKGLKCFRDFKRLKNKPDVEAKPCHRAPPITPPNTYESGFCIMVFDVNTYGRTENIRGTECTHKNFKLHSETIVGTWSYTPKVERGIPVTQKDVKTKLTYRITNEKGILLPGPPGAMPKDYKPGKDYILKDRQKQKAAADTEL